MLLQSGAFVVAAGGFDELRKLYSVSKAMTPDKTTILVYCLSWSSGFDKACPEIKQRKDEIRQQNQEQPQSVSGEMAVYWPEKPAARPDTGTAPMRFWMIRVACYLKKSAAEEDERSDGGEWLSTGDEDLPHLVLRGNEDAVNGEIKSN